MPTAFGDSGRSPRRPTDAGRYRDAVDAGRTHDKIPVPDPASAPVHTDAEAGGEGTSRTASLEATREQARYAPPETVRADHTNPGRSQLQIPERRMAWLIAVGFAFLIALGLAAAVVTLP
ncbi:MAG TPA: hypothetical protein VHM01_06615 [Alphaproteobacteria bacterium]|nr:hypothetical protein [Alphaproteobacteria bacterium]